MHMACVSPLFQRCLCTYMRQQACTFCTCVTLRRAPEGLEKRKACQLKEVHHCGAGGCGQDVWCSTSIPSAQIAAHLSRGLQT